MGPGKVRRGPFPGEVSRELCSGKQEPERGGRF